MAFALCPVHFTICDEFAVFAGINESRMRAYKSGLAYPGEKTTRMILKAIETIGKEIGVARI